ncbi:MAG: hypothetical protein IPG39_19180 [Bacteroidetes bacterium]|nr:hypothetical protein [Bacteroidota bacterium]
MTWRFGNTQVKGARQRTSGSESEQNVLVEESKINTLKTSLIQCCHHQTFVTYKFPGKMMAGSWIVFNPSLTCTFPELIVLPE